MAYQTLRRSRAILPLIALLVLAFVSVTRAEEPVATPPPAAAAAAAPADAPPAKPAEAKVADPAEESEEKKKEKKDAADTTAKAKTPNIWQRAAAAMKSGEQHASEILALNQTISGHAATIADLRQQLAAANTELAEHRAGVAQIEQALAITPQQRAELAGKPAAVAAAVTTAAQQQAVALAASQGTPPVPALPEQKNAEEVTLEAFTNAAQEPDPMKRAQLFAKASQRFMKPGNN